MGSRVFDVSCNGSMLLKDLIFPGRPAPNRWSNHSSTLNPRPRAKSKSTSLLPSTILRSARSKSSPNRKFDESCTARAVCLSPRAQTLQELKYVCSLMTPRLRVRFVSAKCQFPLDLTSVRTTGTVSRSQLMSCHVSAVYPRRLKRTIFEQYSSGHETSTTTG